MPAGFIGPIALLGVEAAEGKENADIEFTESYPSPGVRRRESADGSIRLDTLTRAVTREDVERYLYDPVQARDKFDLDGVIILDDVGDLTEANRDAALKWWSDSLKRREVIADNLYARRPGAPGFPREVEFAYSAAECNDHTGPVDRVRLAHDRWQARQLRKIVNRRRYLRRHGQPLVIR